MRISKIWMWSAVAAMGLFTSTAKAEIKVGVVDMQRALQSVESGKKAKAQLEKEFTSRKKQLETEEANLRKMSEELQKQSVVMNEETRAKKEREFQERVMKFREATARSQGEINQKEQELTGPILNRLRTVINQVAKQKGYNLILEKNENSVLFSEDKDDLTDAVISTFNSQKG